ncbi:Brefeldin A-inhibited guanine nucleotide-exchange protein 1 [Raphanus sativus]|nr:Brefeldin A-inhibited guanine nucleotide-exchange protein 1 [Raphanus sativus]
MRDSPLHNFIVTSSAIQAIISIAIEDGNYLQDAWEHILTCLSRIEHLQLLEKGALQDPVMMAVVRGGSYDSSAIGPNVSALVRQDQINNFIANLNLLDQIGSFQLNNVYAHSQRLKTEAIVAFVKALCKVQCQNCSLPRILEYLASTKLVEIALIRESFCCNIRYGLTTTAFYEVLGTRRAG